MARYIKANKKVAEYLHLENDRLQLKDGNYILWQGDMLAFGPLPLLNDTMAQIGGISLLPHEAREEQDGTYNRVLPKATDERFVIDEPGDTTEGETEEADAPTTSEEESQPNETEEGNESENTEASDDAEAETTDTSTEEE